MSLPSGLRRMPEHRCLHLVQRRSGVEPRDVHVRVRGWHCAVRFCMLLQRQVLLGGRLLRERQLLRHRLLSAHHDVLRWRVYGHLQRPGQLRGVWQGVHRRISNLQRGHVLQPHDNDVSLNVGKEADERPERSLRPFV